MTTLVYNDKRRNNYDHFLDLLDQTHINRYQDFNITFEYKKLAEQMLSECEFMDACSLEEKQKLFNEIKIKHLYQGQVLYSRNQDCRELIIVLSGVLKLGMEFIRWEISYSSFYSYRRTIKYCLSYF